jgi:hypothetical protein
MRSPLLLLAAAVPSVAACTLPAPEPAPDADAPSSTATAIVVVERADTLRGDTISARFVRVKQGLVDDAALRMAGVTEDLPALGTCSAPVESTASAPNRAVELLDVGQVSLASADTAQPNAVLLPRSMPDPAGVVSGYFYASRATDTFAGGSQMTLKASGGSDLRESFAVNVTAPRDLADIHVTPAATGLDIAWEKGEAHDVVYVDVLSPRLVVRCAAADTGRLAIPSTVINGIDEGQLAVHRLHKEAFRAKGIDPGEVRFDTAKVVTFRR